MNISRKTAFDGNGRLKRPRRLSNMRKLHVNPRFPALTAADAATM
jgi:hypothetical protein